MNGAIAWFHFRKVVEGINLQIKRENDKKPPVQVLLMRIRAAGRSLDRLLCALFHIHTNKDRFDWRLTLEPRRFQDGDLPSRSAAPASIKVTGTFSFHPAALTNTGETGGGGGGGGGGDLAHLHVPVAWRWKLTERSCF